MKTLFNRSLAVVPLMVLLAACGSKTAETSAPGVSPAPSSGGGSSATTYTVPTVQAGAGGCSHPVVSYVAPFSETVTFSNGNNAANNYKNTATKVYADQDLRVQIIPQSGGAGHNYSKLAATLTLLKDGVPVDGATVRLPTELGYQNADGNWYTKGITVGAKSEIADFSSYLTPGNHQYSIRVSDVETDYVCKTYCVASNYQVYMGYYANCGDGTYGYYCTDTTMLNSCKQLNCDVQNAVVSKQFSVTVKIETDNTPCLN